MEYALDLLASYTSILSDKNKKAKAFTDRVDFPYPRTPLLIDGIIFQLTEFVNVYKVKKLFLCRVLTNRIYGCMMHP